MQDMHDFAWNECILLHGTDHLNITPTTKILLINELNNYYQPHQMMHCLPTIVFQPKKQVQHE
jgi:hypothetical protein